MCLVGAPFAVLYLKGTIAYYAILIIFAFAGLTSALSNSSSFGLASFFPMSFVFNVGTGQGIAGIFSNLLNFLVLFVFGEGSDESLIRSAYAYFFLSALVIAYSLYKSIKLSSNPFFVGTGVKCGFLDAKQAEGIKIEDGKEGQEMVPMVDDKEAQSPSEKKEKASFISVLPKVLYPCFMMFSSFFLLFLIFPGQLFKPNLFGINPGMKINLILFTFNL